MSTEQSIKQSPMRLLAANRAEYALLFSVGATFPPDMTDEEALETLGTILREYRELPA